MAATWCSCSTNGSAASRRARTSWPALSYLGLRIILTLMMFVFGLDLGLIPPAVARGRRAADEFPTVLV